MKKGFIVLLIALVSLMFVSCKQTNGNNTPKDLYIGYISIEKTTLYLDEVEWITDENLDRIKELGLSGQNDMPNGYYIHNPSSDRVSFKITEETVYNFIDWGNDFVGKDEDRNYSTTQQEAFITYLNTYSDKGAKLPFWVETKDGYVISVTEQLVN